MASKRGLFGTNGIRGVVNRDLNPGFIVEASLSIGTWARENSKIILGMDTRISGKYIKKLVGGVLISMGHDVLDAGILPTPALQLSVSRYGNLGIMITASHNPPEYNGIKVIYGDGTEIGEEDENKIEEIFIKKEFKKNPWNIQGEFEEIKNLNIEYVKKILSMVKKNEISGKRIEIALDCSNGASFETSPYLLRALGINFTTLNCQPDGTFPSHLPEPKEENLQEVMKIVKGNYDLGAVHDGDADRVAFIDGNGRFVTGDKILAIFTLEKIKKKRGIIVVPVSVSMAIEEIAKKYGSKVVYTKVGAPIVARKMMETGAIFGGEDNGGYIFPEMQYCRDGGMALAKMIEILALEGTTLEEKLKEIPEYYNFKGTIKIEKEKIDKVMRKLEEIVKGKNVVSIDGIKVIEGDSWVLVRPSGTEPLIRIYSEAKDKESAQRIYMDYRSLIESIIKEI
ncbi:MAG: phosphoglucosamine mutase [Euryarchaeota archaeon]|nr:phosphoglucosamine mutase [Euryarchaeota archaeon]